MRNKRILETAEQQLQITQEAIETTIVNNFFLLVTGAQLITLKLNTSLSFALCASVRFDI